LALAVYSISFIAPVTELQDVPPYQGHVAFRYAWLVMMGEEDTLSGSGLLTALCWWGNPLFFAALGLVLKNRLRLAAMVSLAGVCAQLAALIHWSGVIARFPAFWLWIIPNVMLFVLGGLYWRHGAEQRGSYIC
jgi:hypothetical protein